jgi:hypothetical protein
MKQNVLPLDKARWQLAILWFPCGGVIFIVLILQSLGGAYGEDVQRLWSWALPNFLPTLALMVSVFAADALKANKKTSYLVNRNFCRLSVWISAFYLIILTLSIVSFPLLNYFNNGSMHDRIKILQTSNLWLGPIQGLVVMVLGVLFFLKEDEKDNKGDK